MTIKDSKEIVLLSSKYRSLIIGITKKEKEGDKTVPADRC
jgi:hypothetical protein